MQLQRTTLETQLLLQRQQLEAELMLQKRGLEMKLEEDGVRMHCEKQITQAALSIQQVVSGGEGQDSSVTFIDIVR